MMILLCIYPTTFQTGDNSSYLSFEIGLVLESVHPLVPLSKRLKSNLSINKLMGKDFLRLETVYFGT